MKPDSGTPPPSAGMVCANCGAPLYGEYCYACGQPVKGLVRHLSGVLGDVLDTMLNIDSRVIRTLPALFLRPGFLSREYFAGRRVRYVTPFRLMFFLALAAFFVMQLALDNAASQFGAHNTVRVLSPGFEQARNVAEVEASKKQALDKIDSALHKPNLPAVARGSLEFSRAQVLSGAANRLAELKQADKSATLVPAGTAVNPAVTPAAPSSAANAGKADSSDANIHTNLDLPGGDSWDLPRDRIHLSWLPAFANDWLNQAGQRMHDNIVALKKGSPDSRRAMLQRMFAGVFSVLPQTMFVLLPLFAVILKVFYIFKRRLYMEHLIVALHSHAFIFLTLLLLFAVAALKTFVPLHASWLDVPLGLATAALWIWMFLYLLLMQKRVYMQGWFFTTIKYCCVGICYTVLLSIAISIAFVLSLART